MESILTSIKKLIGIDEECDAFDPDIIMHINSALMILAQLGVGPPKGFRIQDAEATWSDFLQDDTNLESVKSYIHHKVVLMFDPPTNSAVIAAREHTIRELEERLCIAAEFS